MWCDKWCGAAYVIEEHGRAVYNNSLSKAAKCGPNWPHLDRGEIKHDLVVGLLSTIPCWSRLAFTSWYNLFLASYIVWLSLPSLALAEETSGWSCWWWWVFRFRLGYATAIYDCWARLFIDVEKTMMPVQWNSLSSFSCLWLFRDSVLTRWTEKWRAMAWNWCNIVLCRLGGPSVTSDPGRVQLTVSKQDSLLRYKHTERRGDVVETK